MTERLKRIFNEIDRCETFADIGCDHGYIAKEMLKSGKCKEVIISDISEKSLSKAEKLLSGYVAEKKAFPFVSDGFKDIKKDMDSALIAGMGGEEISQILDYGNLPPKLVLQPMRNCDKVRDKLILRGYKIEKDFVFFVKGIYYPLIVAVKGKDVLTEEERIYGRTNIKERPSDFVKMIREEMDKLNSYLNRENIGEDKRKEISDRIKEIEKYV